jgi:hypothetical protein
MEVIPARPPVGELVFELFGRPLHPELFDILACRHVQREDYQATLRITRTGHLLTWENDEVLLTEVADADQNLSDHRRLLHHRMRGEHTSTVRCCAGVTYQNSFQVEKLPPEIFVHVHDEILADGGKRGLLYHFQPHHRLAMAPLGFVTMETRTGCLFVTAFHTFPEELTVVKSQTLIERK